MNPPAALHGAMSRERKPFTYTPGGLDLSEIKSERMAQRLMRNAMNQGVPEKPTQTVNSPVNPSGATALPNFNCLPVQVFPTINLPANPKTLLRTRSNPDPRDGPIQRVAPPFVNNVRVENNNTFNKNTPPYQQVNNNRPTSMFEFNSTPANNYSSPRPNYGSDGYTAPILPEISYDAEYFRAPAKIYSGMEPISPKLEANEENPLPKFEMNEYKLEINNGNTLPNFKVNKQDTLPNFEINKDDTLPKFEVNNDNMLPNFDVNKEDKSPMFEINEETRLPTLEKNEERLPKLETKEEKTLPKLETNEENTPYFEINDDKDKTTNGHIETSIDLTIKPIADIIIPVKTPSPVQMMAAEDNAASETEQREVKVVKKEVKKENKVEEQNGSQNGDADTEAEMTVKLPTKKSAAKTETKVEVVKKILPDGSVEEVKTTTTRTTIDGRTEIKTKTETTIIPKEEESEEEEVEEEEEEETAGQEVQQVEEVAVEEPETTTMTIAAPKENGHESKVVKTEERSETTTTTSKKVMVIEDSPKEEQSVEVEEEEEAEEETIEEAVPVTVVLKKLSTPEPETSVEESAPAKQEEEEEEVEEQIEESEQKVVKDEVKAEVDVEEEEEVEEEEAVPVKKEEVKETPKEEEEEIEEEEEYEEAEEKAETEVKAELETESNDTADKEQTKEVIKEEVKQEKEEPVSEKPAEEPKEQPKESEEKIIKVEILPSEEKKPEPATQTEFKIPIREPSVPLDKVEDIEIKPIGSTPIISKTHTENTEIIRGTIDPSSGLSTQTEYNKIENIVTVNRTTKILDHNYENITQQGVPTVKTYFPPPSIDRISTSPLPSRPYQPVYPPEPTTERRHSLLLERLSMERQMPSEVYSYSNQSYEQTQYQEPRVEVLTVSNVKPSSITNQQWYQQKNQQNVIYNNTSSTPTPASQPWVQPKSQPQQQYSPQPQPHYQAQHQPKPQYQPPQQQYQPAPQPSFQRGTTPQPQYQAPTTPQPQYQAPTTPQYQPSYLEPTTDRAPSSFSSYTPTPTWVSNTAEPQQSLSQQSQYSYKDTTDSYQSTQQYSSSYVPPPWEQDSSYTSVNNTSQVYYQPAPLPQTQSYSPAPSTQSWKQPSSKFSKTAPIAYIPPAPNQSFVRSASTVEPPRAGPGRKTYYSEYERRYITVPESTYIPSETKFQAQPDPSPQYYYDNNEPAETVEPQWRRELREFTEKTSQTTTTEQTSVQPPWEADSKFKTQSSYTPTPTWSQTLRPRSWRERSFESEYVSQEWPKNTNTLGRGRPLSTTGRMESGVGERARGVSVDRYNPNSYQSPAEHPPVQAHTLTTPAPHAGYHNPNVPAYHARASAEPREQPVSYQPRVYREARASPLQSRSFKYLQWITGTEN